MKKSIVYFLVLILLSCSQKKEENNTIKIDISGFGKDITYVLNQKDSITKSEKEIVFTISKINEPELYTLRVFTDSLKKRPIDIIPFWYENKDVTLVGKWNARKKYITPLTIKGGKLQKIENKFSEILTKYNKITSDLISSGASKEEVNNKFTELFKKFPFDNIKLSFEMPNNRISLDKIVIYNSKISKDSLRLYYSKLDKKLKNSKNGVSLNEIINTNKLRVGDFIKNFTATDVNGKEVHLFDYKGKIILLDFWASWCKPCRKQIRSELVGLNRNYKDKGLVIISFSVDKKSKENEWKKATVNDGITWVSISNLKGFNENPIAYQYSVTAIPRSFLINKEGVIVNSFLDYKEGQHLIEQEIIKLLKKE